MYQLERDEAVARFAKLQGLFMAVQAQLRAFEIPNEPLQRIATDAEATSPQQGPTHADIIARIGAN
jgi:hypothetical protein